MDTLKKKDYELIEAAGDGACLFNSVAQNQHLDQNMKDGDDGKKYTFKLSDDEIEPISLTLRKDAVDWLEKNLSEMSPLGQSYEQSILDEIEEGDLEGVKDISSYFKYMRKYDKYGGQPEIFGLSNFLKRNIIVYKEVGNEYVITRLGSINPEYGRDSTIYLHHNFNQPGVKKPGQFHFNLLYPKSRAEVKSKTKYDSLFKPPKKKPSTPKKKPPTPKKKPPTPKKKPPTPKKKPSESKSESSDPSNVSSSVSKSESSDPSNVSSSVSTDSSDTDKAPSKPKTLKPKPKSKSNKSLRLSLRSSYESSDASITTPKYNLRKRKKSKSSNNIDEIQSYSSSDKPVKKSKSKSIKKSKSKSRSKSKTDESIIVVSSASSSSSKHPPLESMKPSYSIGSSKSINPVSSVKPVSVKPKPVKPSSVKTMRCGAYKLKSPPPGCKKVEGCKWVPKVGCLDDNSDLIKSEIEKKKQKMQMKTDMKSFKSKPVKSKPVKSKPGPKPKNSCKTFKKNKDPKCDGQEGCIWTKNKGCENN